MSEPTHKWCNKCGYTGLSAVHENCGYEAIPFEKAPVQAVNEQVPVTEVVEREVCRHDDDGYLVSRFKSKRLTVDVGSLELGPLYAKPVPPTPIEVTDELLKDLYDHSHDDEWVGQDVGTEALRRIVQRAFKYVGLEVKL